jgi:GDP-D-mannose dehydratase
MDQTAVILVQHGTCRRYLVDPHEEETRFFLHYGDLTDATNLIRLLQEIQPSEIYNLAAQSHVQVSFETPEYTAQRRWSRNASSARGDAYFALA